MSELSKNILEEIKEQHITPKPKWEFVLRNYMVWIMFALFVVMGSISFSVLIFMLTSHDWDIYRNLGKSFWEFLLMSLPYLWIILIVAFSIFAWYDLKKTRTGYRFTFTKIGLANIGLSVLLGTLLFYSGLGMRIDNVFADNLPFYRAMHPARGMDIWENPERGLLIGEITSFIDDEGFNLKDLRSQDWEVKTDQGVWGKGAKNNIGMIVRIIGSVVSDGVFEAKEVRPWIMNCDVPNKPINLPCRSIQKERIPFPQAQILIVPR